MPPRSRSPSFSARWEEDRHPKTAITVRQAIAQRLEVAELEDTTRERYEDLIRLYILPTFGDLLASRVDAELLERFYARQKCCSLCSGRPPTGHVCRPLSSSTARKIHYIIHGAMDRAVRWRHLGVKWPLCLRPPSPAPTEPDPPSAEEVTAVLNEALRDPERVCCCDDHGYRPAPGEVSAPRWRHIDFDRSILWLWRSNAHTKNGIKEKEPKQRRKVAIDRDLRCRGCRGCRGTPDGTRHHPTRRRRRTPEPGR